MVATSTTLELSEIPAERVLVPIIGTMPLIVNAWSGENKQKMLDKEQGRKTPRAMRDPQRDYELSLYRLPNEGYGFPALAFKKATVDAARFFGKDVKLVELRQFLFMNGVPSANNEQVLVPIEGEPKMREDMVRVGQSGTDLRYRGEFPEWRAVLDVTYITSSLSRQSVLTLIDAGGMGVGVGNWRPEKKGMYGTYNIDNDRKVEIVETERRK